MFGFPVNAALLLAAANLFAGSNAHITFGCGGSILQDRSDPLTHPGKISPHAHRIAGGSAFSLTMDYDLARTSTCSSCPIKADLSNYWTPKLYFRAQDGTFESVPTVGQSKDEYGGMTVYYLQRGDDKNIKAFPPNFRMFAGDVNKRSFTGDFPAQAINYACLGTNKPETNEIPNYNCPGGLRAQVFFPSCWDGKNLDSPDHKSHMSYPVSGNYNGGKCPASHPVQLVSLFYEVLYNTNLYANEYRNGKHPFVWANGDTTGYSFHGDFINGWDVDVLQAVIDECDDPRAFGSIQACNPIKDQLFTGAEQSQCRIPSFFNEVVTGKMNKLPGCNPVTSTPEELAAAKANPGQCTSNDVETVQNPAVPFTDLSSKGFSFVGCALDLKSQGRTLTKAVTSSNTMTAETCANFCKGKNAKFFGLEYSRECFCGDSVAADRMPSGNANIIGACTMPCSGAAGEICGGPDALSLYEVCADAKNCQNKVGSGSSKPVSTSTAAPTSTLPVSVTKEAVSTPSKTTTSATSSPSAVLEDDEETVCTCTKQKKVRRGSRAARRS